MHVTIVRGLNSTSMEKYGTDLIDAFHRFSPATRVDEVRPGLESFGANGGRLRKARVYYDRYLAYPQRLSRLTSDIFHVTDHAHAHLVRGLDPSRTVVTCHDLMAIVDREGVRDRKRVRSVGERAFRYSVEYLSMVARVVADSESTRHDLIEQGLCQPERIRVVYCGVSPAFGPARSPADAPRFRSAKNLPRGRLLLHVGSTAPYKNLPGVFRVLRVLVRELGQDVNLVKVGAPFSDDQRAMIAECGLADRIVHLGMLPEQELVSAYQSADVLLFPSFYEGFGWPPLEAMACGTPVVMSDAGSLPEVGGAAAIQHAAADVEGQARSVAALLSDGGFHESVAAKGLVQAKLFSWEKSTRALLGVYAEILSGGTGSVFGRLQRSAV